MSNISTVTSTPVNPVNVATADPAQEDFLAALKKFEAALKNAEANPNDPVLAEQLKLAGAALQQAQKALAGGNAADKAMNTAFESDTLGNLDQIIADCATGTLTDVENDVYAFSTNPGIWNETLEGLNVFNSNPR